LTLWDLVPSLGKTGSTSLKLLREVRQQAYDQKYSEQTYDDNVRKGGHWRNEVSNLLGNLGVSDITRRKIINVGIGNGLEAVGLFDHVVDLIGCDVGEESLRKARRRVHSNAQLLPVAAEDLKGVKTGSQQIYVSLRTFQSSYFDVAASMYEAHRVLCKGGVAIISIANGYLGPNQSPIPGMLIPRTTVVDRNRPFKVADEVRRRMTILRFDDIGVTTGFGEIYVYGRRAG
jgi:ubiquinone/menaquinone biosynthesis C-methylase UbiE